MNTTMLAILCILLHGCVVKDITGDARIVIGCFGDSNTMTTGGSWCDNLSPLVSPYHWEVMNYGWPGATARNENPSGPPPCGGILAFGVPKCSLWWIQSALTGFPPPLNPYLAPMDVVLLAYGTNDIRNGVTMYGNSALQLIPPLIVHAYREDIAALPAGTLVLIALVPPFNPYAPSPPAPAWDPRWNQVVLATNQLIRQSWPANRIVDFYAVASVPGDYADLVHLNAGGQQKRAAAAYNALIHS